MLHMKLTGLFGLLLFLFSSCIKNNPKPAWIQIDAWKLEANPVLSGEEGELNHNFTDAYVYVGGKTMGIFELPIKLPVLLEGTMEIQVYPVVRNNGIAATKKMYPFCEPHKVTANLVKGETIHIVPVTRYSTATHFAWTEDFESAGIKFTTDPTSKASIEQILHTDAGKTGHCGHVALTLSDSVWTGYSHAQLNLPKGGTEVYLEVEYKVTNNLLTGVIGVSSGSKKINPFIQLNAQAPADATWKKIYLDLKEIVSSSTTADYFEHYLQAVIDPGKTSSNVYIDNIKVIHL